MGKIFIHLANGFEEIEAITPIDILRRGGCDVVIVSVTGKKEVTGSHNITLVADTLFEPALYGQADMLILPGGMPGSKNLNEHEELKTQLKKAFNEGKWIAAICAAPMVLGGLGILTNKKATCYPGFESELKGAQVTGNLVEVDGNVITGKGPGAAAAFGFKLLEVMKGKQTADDIKRKMLFE